MYWRFPSIFSIPFNINEVYFILPLSSGHVADNIFPFTETEVLFANRIFVTLTPLRKEFFTTETVETELIRSVHRENKNSSL